jgi:hypothetical protein
VPLFNGMGCSAHTPFKQASFRDFLARQHLEVCRTIAAGHPDFEYVYIDLFAGQGFRPDRPEQEGSPVIALRLLEESGLRYRAVLMEQSRSNVETLRGYLWELGLCDPGKVRFVVGRFQDNLRSVLNDLGSVHPYRCGLAYADPNCLTPKDTSVIDGLVTIANHHATHYLDLLLHTQGSSYKLVATVARNGQKGFEAYRDAPTLDALLRRVPKKSIRVGAPEESKHWTFLFFTNLMRERRLGADLGWFPIDTPEGRRNLSKLCLTRAKFDEFCADASWLPIF